MQPYALRALLSSHPPKDLDDTAVHTATHATQAALISHQNTGILSSYVLKHPSHY